MEPTDYTKKLYHLIVRLLVIAVVGAVSLGIYSGIKTDRDKYEQNKRDVERLNRELGYTK